MFGLASQTSQLKNMTVQHCKQKGHEWRLDYTVSILLNAVDIVVLTETT
jgi:hypothetical protein